MELARRELDLSKKDDQQRLEIKLGLVRQLFKQGIRKSKIRHLLVFIGHYLQFDKSEFLSKFEEELQIIRKSMGIREAILHEVEERGHAKGLSEGVEKGYDEKERIVVTRGWKRGMAPSTIADLADMPLEKVEAIIQELEQGDLNQE